MPNSNDKARVLDHYDRASSYYRSLWGEHLHHGFWISGGESKETAQLQLVDHLAHAAGIQPHAKILDIGCGFGASSIHLARKYRAQATGINISPVQIEIATQAAAQAAASASFLCMDAEALAGPSNGLPLPFDVLWSIESISHYQDVPQFFLNAAKYLKLGGTFALTDWFKREPLLPRDHRKFLRPIEQSMLVQLHTMRDYENYLAAAGLTVVRRDILNQHTAKTWDFCLDIIKDKALWQLAASHGPDFLRFLRGFKAMRAGFSSGHFVYGLLVAEKSANSRVSHSDFS